uniref:Uncharacterized protein n=1 Tax=Falco tinnunculus TaxID=100819 RepID=A0A8C4UYV0_FALTI
MSCSESPAANSFLVDSLISSGRGEAAGAGGGGGGGGGYYPNSGIYLPQASDLSYGLQSCGLFPVLSKRNEGTSQSMVPSSHPYVSGMEVWLDPPRSCRMEDGPGRSSPGRQGLEAGRLRLRSSPCFPPPDHTYKVQIRRFWFFGSRWPGRWGGGQIRLQAIHQAAPSNSGLRAAEGERVKSLFGGCVRDELPSRACCPAGGCPELFEQRQIFSGGFRTSGRPL